MAKTAGIIGGLGPIATLYFFDMVTRYTDATCDQEHVDMIISNISSTPDRTSFLLDNSNENPTTALVEAAKNLEKSGADFLVLTCNTAHYFYDDIKSNINIPFINILDETILYAKKQGLKKVCILATDGTIKSELYQKVCKKHEVEFIIPNHNQQKIVMEIIYKYMKKGLELPPSFFDNFISEFSGMCDGFILGCTELSILKNNYNLSDEIFIDSLKVLAQRTIQESGKKIK